MHAVTAEGLVKRFGSKRAGPTTALDGFDLEVAQGSVCGLLGPNGAGKTTAVRILTTLLRADGGRATVAGHDVARAGDRVRASIGLVGQHAAVDEILTGRQNLEMFGRLYHLRPAAARARADELLARFGLADAANRAARQVLRRHAPPPRPGRRADPVPAGAVPRRADHRPRPAQPHRGLGRRSATWWRPARRCC